jgi:DNA-binding LacI/PurR family transcriptional regulator
VDVARLAGVSRQTVSNVLNDRTAYFAPDTRARVTAAMESLGYRPSRAAQSMRSLRSMQIGYHMFGEQLDAVNGFTLTFLQALIKAAGREGYQLVVFTHHDDAPLQVFKDLVARRNVDAFVVSESQVDDPRVRLLAEAGVPFASFGRLAPDLPQQWVDVDNVVGMSPLVDYLVAKGHREFAYVGAEGGQYWKRERLDGFRIGLARHGLRVPDDAVILGSDAQIRGALRDLLTRRHPPSAIVTSSDAVAALVINVSNSLGLRVGGDIAVTGFDGGALGLLTEPTLTSVRIPVETIARELVARCRSEITSGPTGLPGVLVPTEIVRGGSA